MKDSIIKIKSNFEIHKDYVLISINPNFFEMVPIHSAAHSFLDENNVSIFGNEKNELLVELRPKVQGIDLEKLAYKFNNDLIKRQHEFNVKEDRSDKVNQ